METIGCNNGCRVGWMVTSTPLGTRGIVRIVGIDDTVRTIATYDWQTAEQIATLLKRDYNLCISRTMDEEIDDAVNSLAAGENQEVTFGTVEEDRAPIQIDGYTLKEALVQFLSNFSYANLSWYK